MRSPRRILLVRLSHLGDVVHALPIYHALRAEHPDAALAWAVQPEFAQLLECLPSVRIIPFDRRGGMAAWPTLRAELARYRADWTIDAQGNVKSALVSLCSAAPKRSGFGPSDWTERFAAHVLTDPAPPLAGGAVHAIERARHLARHVAPAGSALAVEPLFRPRADDLERGRRRCAELFSARPGAAEVILHVAKPDDVRSWPAASFEHLARALAREGSNVALISGPAEAELGSKLAFSLRGASGVMHWVGQRGLRELAGFFAAAGERGARLVCCDSGPMHLAAACGLAVVALCGPQDFRRTGPWPPPGERSPHRVLVADPAPPCAPCLARSCTHGEGPVCMTRLSPDAVLRALAELAPEVPSACG